MDQDLLVIGLFGTVIAIGMPLAIAFARRIGHQNLGPPVPPEVAQRLARMEQAIDAIAVEVERISEGQRFTTKLLSERAGAEPARALPPRAPNE